MKNFKTHFTLVYKDFVNSLSEDRARRELESIQKTYLSLEEQGILEYRSEFLRKIRLLKERIFTLLQEQDEKNNG